nr:hypothetical protein CFP56_78767 [Quercus suber]
MARLADAQRLVGGTHNAVRGSTFLGSALELKSWSRETFANDYFTYVVEVMKDQDCFIMLLALCGFIPGHSLLPSSYVESGRKGVLSMNTMILARQHCTWTNIVMPRPEQKPVIMTTALKQLADRSWLYFVFAPVGFVAERYVFGSIVIRHDSIQETWRTST